MLQKSTNAYLARAGMAPSAVTSWAGTRVNVLTAMEDCTAKLVRL
jgi:hypothetical protein